MLVISQRARPILVVFYSVPLPNYSATFLLSNTAYIQVDFKSELLLDGDAGVEADFFSALAKWAGKSENLPALIVFYQCCALSNTKFILRDI